MLYSTVKLDFKITMEFTSMAEFTLKVLNGFIMFRIEFQMYTYHWLGLPVNLRNHVTEPKSIYLCLSLRIPALYAKKGLRS